MREEGRDCGKIAHELVAVEAARINFTLHLKEREKPSLKPVCMSRRKDRVHVYYYFSFFRLYVKWPSV